tara:strand:+ start:238 stop:2373 length:2136 start_codon:yes stop_codon:yes gene_type:complete
MVLSALGTFPGSGWAKATKATQVEISLVDGLVSDSQGNVYFSQHDHNSVMKVSPDGSISRYAGTGSSGFRGDGGPAETALLKRPAGLAFDSKGNLYIADRENHRVRKVDVKGTITTIAGNGTAGFEGDGGPATQARLNLPSGIAVDAKGNLYIADRSNERIRVVDTRGKISTYAGNGKEGWGGDGGPATKATLNKPFGLALDGQGSLYIADRGNNRVRKVDTDGIMHTIAGDGAFYFIGDNGPAYAASVAGPTGVAVDKDGNLLIADRNNNRIRIVDKNGLIRTVMGTGKQEYNGDSEVPRETNLRLPFAIAFSSDGHLLVADRSHYVIRKVDLRLGKVRTIAGNGNKQFKGDGGPATGASLSFPHGIVVDSKDNVIFSDKAHYRLRSITPDGIIQTIAGNGKRGSVGNGIPALEASLYGPTQLAFNPKKELYIISPSGFVSLVRKIDIKGFITQVLSTADKKYLAGIHKGKLGLSARSEIVEITQISDFVFDKKGNMFFSDRINHQIRKMDPNGVISTIAGTGSSDFTGDGGPALEATFADPVYLEIDQVGNLYVADTTNKRIRKIDTNGVITTIAGNGSMEDTGDGGPALEAGILAMDDLAFSPQGELHFVSGLANRVRKIKRDGKIVTVAGKGYQGYFGDGGLATKAMLKQPAGIAFDSKGNLYITDLGNNRIRKVDKNGTISTLAGSGTYGWADEGETVEILFQNFP